ncbi:MAG: hypothetical protein ACI4I9_05735 [Porcipelethomonas sp.]
MFSRYADAQFLLDNYIRTGRLREFLAGFTEVQNEETAWDVWKHRVFNKSFGEFRAEIEKPVVQEPVNIEAVVKDSFDILKDFNPHEEVN